MTRPVRIEFEGALYHITSRGNRREDIYEDNEDRIRFLEVLEQVSERDNWVCHAYCLMTNHYHLLIETPDGNLSRGMRQLNGVYTQAYNRRHGCVGHLFQGRYKAILVDADSYLLELSRYIVLNPVRAKMVNQPEEWLWSSYLMMIGEKTSPKWLAVDGLLAQFSATRREAIESYRQFVLSGIGKGAVWKNLRRQIYLGDDNFVKQMQEKHEELSNIVGVPKAQKRPPAKSLEKIFLEHEDRNTSIRVSYATGEYSYQQIADFYKLHFSTIGAVVREGND